MVGTYPIAEAYKKEERETFADATDAEKTNTSVVRIFISVGLMALAIVLGFIFLWAYRTEKTLMIVVLSVVVFIYALLVMVFALVQREKLDFIYFQLIMGSSAFMVIMMILVIIIFSILASRRMNAASGSASGIASGTYGRSSMNPVSNNGMSPSPMADYPTAPDSNPY